MVNLILCKRYIQSVHRKTIHIFVDEAYYYSATVRAKCRHDNFQQLQSLLPEEVIWSPEPLCPFGLGVNGGGGGGSFGEPKIG